MEIISSGAAGSARSLSVRDRLRGVTAVRHRALDRFLGRHRVLSTADRYARFLAVHHRVRARLFGAQEGCAPTATWAVQTASHSKALVDDLNRLGLSSATLDVVPTGVVAPASEPAAWGVLYVTEGSRLGGAVLDRRLRSALGSGVPSSFLAADAAASRRWRRLCLDLETRADPQPAAVAAAAAFDVYLEEFGLEFAPRPERVRD